MFECLSEFKFKFEFIWLEVELEIEIGNRCRNRKGNPNQQNPAQIQYRQLSPSPPSLSSRAAQPAPDPTAHAHAPSLSGQTARPPSRSALARPASLPPSLTRRPHLVSSSFLPVPEFISSRNPLAPAPSLPRGPASPHAHAWTRWPARAHHLPSRNHALSRDFARQLARPPSPRAESIPRFSPGSRQARMPRIPGSPL